MKLKYELTFIDIGDKTVAVPIDADDKGNMVLQCNESAVAMLKLLKDDITEAQLVSALTGMYSNDEEQLRTYVQKFTQKLRENQLLEP